MKTIGKIAALAMTLSLALVLGACGGSSSSSAASSERSSSAAESSTAAESSEAESLESTAAASTSSESEAVDKYTNDYFGIAYMLPSGWSFTDADSLAEANSQAAAIATKSAIGMIATSADEQTGVMAVIEEANDINDGQTAEEHLDAQVEQMVESASSNSVSYTSESATVTFDGASTELPAAMTELSVNGKTIHLCQVVMEKDGDFLDIVIQGPTEDDVNEALEGFHLILS